MTFDMPNATVFKAKGNLMASPWKFKQYGESGIPSATCFPLSGAWRTRDHGQVPRQGAGEDVHDAASNQALLP